MAKTIAKSVLESGLGLQEIIAALQYIYEEHGDVQVIFEIPGTSWTLSDIEIDDTIARLRGENNG